MKAAAILAVFILLSSPACAAGLSTEELEKSCKDLASNLDHEGNIEVTRKISAIRGMWYVGGMIDMGRIWHEVERNVTPYCAPDDGMSLQQGCRVFVKYTTAHPETLNLGANVVFIAAMKDAFPCPKN